MAQGAKETVSSEASLRSKVFTRLENDILNGHYAVGENFTEARVAEDLGVSRTPVREAIRQLELEGLVTYIPNKGATVKGLSKEDIQDIGEIRMKIEGIAARRAAVNIQDEQIAELHEILDLENFYTQRGDFQPILDLDTRFHKLIFQASGSRLLSLTLRQFHHYLQQSRETSMHDKDRAEKMLLEHQRILEAIEVRDSEKAETQMAQHVKNATKNINKLQERKDKPAK